MTGARDTRDAVGGETRAERRLLHQTRSVTIETFNERFKGIVDAHAHVPTRGLRATRRYALGAILVINSSYSNAISRRPTCGWASKPS